MRIPFNNYKEYNIHFNGNVLNTSIVNPFSKSEKSSYHIFEIGDYAMRDTDICRVKSRYILSRSYGGARIGYCGDLIILDKSCSDGKFRLLPMEGIDLSKETSLVSNSSVSPAKIFHKQKMYDYMFDMANKLTRLYVELKMIRSNRHYYDVDNEIYEILTISKEEFDGFVMNKEYGSCKDYILNKRLGKRDKICNVANGFMEYMSGKLILNMRNRENDIIDGSICVPLCIDKEDPTRILFRIVTDYIDSNKEGRIESMFIGDLLSQNLEIYDCNMDMFKEYVELSYNNNEKIHYIYESLVKRNGFNLEKHNTYGRD